MLADGAATKNLLVNCKVKNATPMLCVDFLETGQHGHVSINVFC